MSDLISRQAAIEALTNEYMAVGILGEQWAISQCIDAIKKLPTIDHVKHGKWIPVDEKNDAFDCSECDAMVQRRYSYCPNCGAKMYI